jgi:hypothetical protein
MKKIRVFAFFKNSPCARVSDLMVCAYRIFKALRANSTLRRLELPSKSLQISVWRAPHVVANFLHAFQVELSSLNPQHPLLQGILPESPQVPKFKVDTKVGRFVSFGFEGSQLQSLSRPSDMYDRPSHCSQPHDDTEAYSPHSYVKR